MAETTYTVKGMSCGHCASSVTEEVSGIVGVSAVNVDVASGKVTITSDTALDVQIVDAAVTEAGYQLVS
ncbi:heavy-metal-associated domain-containing protein [Amycolatopsis alba]|uniref:Heavy metal transporter n=1 Tax=Amycolatopsis alba DSM 44262 TaxID=1125972 RepID=A0A229RBT7_AMYAL|nr:heavy metal-associated domain-containing protein [Amycolatopsis alba]OXM43969.1 heavy metal transporter [Amycolatopsis alba DSM 44262]